MKLFVISSAFVAISALASGSKAPSDKVGQFTCSAIGDKVDQRGAHHDTVIWSNYFATQPEAQNDAVASCQLEYQVGHCQVSSCYQVDANGDLQHVN